jgi:hypothetical protein
MNKRTRNTLFITLSTAFIILVFYFINSILRTNNTTKQNSNPRSRDLKSTIEQNPNSEAENSANSTLLRASSQLDKVYSSAKTANEQQVISLLQNILKKMIENEDYSYKADADAAISKYNYLTTAEKNNIKNAILNNIDFQTFYQLKNIFGL